ncbi:NadS family protein [Vibrio sp. D431a]|uniref:NadS family protein n=1 Tax=Vibrio sp. D431a TaxID=2837388 RepID=UPI002555DAE2|nr:NadS family protein [Vibrio sp. D431a]MDK9789928.1 helix-turn-helix domain-containing protein [Vibrio sp. D431a]
MEDKLFDQLKTSLEQAVEISKGECQPSRVRTIQKPNVRAIRESLGISRAEFASVINSSEETVKSWELNRRSPTGLTAKVLLLMAEDLDIFHLLKQLNSQVEKADVS